MLKQSEVFSTGADFQDAVEIHVLQGERQFAKDNKSLGIFKLKGIPSAPRGVPKINVTFQLDVNGLLAVSAREEQSGIEQSIKIEGASVLAREEVAKMIQDAEQNAFLDKSKKSLVNVTYELDNLLAKMEKVIDSSEKIDLNATRCFSLIHKQLQYYYHANKFQAITTKMIKNLKYVINILSLVFLKKELNNNSNTSSTSGNVIDVDLAEDL